MPLRYNTAFAVLMLALGGVLLFLSIWLFMLTDEFQIGLLLGPFIMILGIVMLSRPFATVSRHGVDRLALIGPATRSVKMATGEFVAYDGRQFVIVSADGASTRPVRLGRWMARPADWNAAAASVGSRPQA